MKRPKVKKRLRKVRLFWRLWGYGIGKSTNCCPWFCILGPYYLPTQLLMSNIVGDSVVGPMKDHHECPFHLSRIRLISKPSSIALLKISAYQSSLFTVAPLSARQHLLRKVY